MTNPVIPDTRNIANSARLYLGSNTAGGNTYRVDMPVIDPYSKVHYGYINSSGVFYGDCAAFQKHVQWQSGFIIPYISPNGAIRTNGTLTDEALKWYQEVKPSGIRPGDSVYFNSGNSGHVGTVVEYRYDPATQIGIGKIRSLTGNNNNGQVEEQYFTTNSYKTHDPNGEPIPWGTSNLTFRGATRPLPDTYVPEFNRSNLPEAPTDVLITHAPGYAGSPPNSVIMRGYVTTGEGATYIEVTGNGRIRKEVIAESPVRVVGDDGSVTIYHKNTILRQDPDGNVTHTLLGLESNTTTRTLPDGVVETQVYNRLTRVTEVTRTREDSDNPGQALVDRYSAYKFVWLTWFRQLLCSDYKYCAYLRVRMHVILTTLFLCLFLIACTSTQAEPREAVELKKLVGLTNVDWGKRPGGWQPVGGLILVQNDHYALVIERPTKDWVPSTQVLGVLYLGKLSRDDISMLANFIRCRTNSTTGGQLLSKEGRYRILAEVKLKRESCQRQYSDGDIKRAWHVDFVKGTFKPIETKGLICEDILLGNDPSSKHCPH